VIADDVAERDYKLFYRPVFGLVASVDTLESILPPLSRILARYIRRNRTHKPEFFCFKPKNNNDVENKEITIETEALNIQTLIPKI
jgi:hypothetical protein